MRFADRPKLEVSTQVGAPPARVWEVVSDVTAVGSWGGECVDAQWLDGGGPEAGARFRGVQRREGREWETVSTVIESEPGATFAWAVGDVAHPGATWRFSLVAHAGGTEVRYAVELGPGPSGLTAAIASMPDKEDKIIAGRIEEQRRHMTATLEAIKQAAEA